MKGHQSYPRRARRGLGLFEALVAVAVFTVTASLLAQTFTAWTERRALTAEARALADLADTGRQWLERNTGGAPAIGPPKEVAYADLESGRAGTTYLLPKRTARRREMTLWLWRAGSGRTLVLARARDPDGSARTLVPGSGTGVSGIGTIVPDDRGGIRMAGPDISADINAINRDYARAHPRLPLFAREGDLFVVRSFWTGPGCQVYLARDADLCRGDNKMETDLNLGGHNLTGVRNLRVTGAATFEGNATVEGDLTVKGEVTTPDLTVTGDLTIEGSMEVEKTLAAEEGSIAGDLVVRVLRAQTCTGCTP